MITLEEHTSIHLSQQSIINKKIRIVHLMGEVSDLLAQEGLSTEKEIFDRLATEIQNIVYFEIKRAMSQKKDIKC